jgi:hypothetical protein
VSALLFGLGACGDETGERLDTPRRIELASLARDDSLRGEKKDGGGIFTGMFGLRWIRDTSTARVEQERRVYRIDIR